MSKFAAQNVIIKGVSFFDGNIDGKDLKSGTVFIEEQLDESKQTAKGFRTVPYPAVSPDLIRSLMQNEFPLYADVGFATKVTKGASSLIIESVKPRGPAASLPDLNKKAA